MNTKDNLFLFLVLLYASVILVLDYILPLGVSVGSLYILLIIAISFLVESKRALYIITCVCCVLIIVGYFISPENELNYYAFINRAISIVICIFSYLLGLLYISYRKKERTLKEQFMLAMNAAPSAICIVNENSKIVFANKELHRLFGYKLGELVNKPVKDLIPFRYQNFHEEYTNKYHEKPKTRKMGFGDELFAKHIDDTEIPVDIGLTPFVSNNKQMVIASIIDLTMSKEYERKLENEIKERKSFNYSLSHDFMGFMRRIGSFSDYLKTKLKDEISEEYLNYLDIIHSESEKSKKLVEDLSLFLRSGLDTEDFEDVCLNSIINEITSNNSEQIIQNKTSIEYEKLPTIKGNKSKLYLMFANLILNSIKHNNLETTIKLNVLKHDKSIIISISDDGLGMKKEFIEDIFVPFNKYHRKGVTGSGLGLSIVKNIVEQHKGKISVESEINKGTTFFIEFPNEGH